MISDVTIEIRELPIARYNAAQELYNAING